MVGGSVRAGMNLKLLTLLIADVGSCQNPES
jgi:hypothetical protein